MNTLPPRLPPPPRSCRIDGRRAEQSVLGRAILYAAGALALLVVGLRILRAWDCPLPGCGFRAWTGIPCVGCGSTRALLALSEGDWQSAWTLNPLTSFACAGLGLGALLAGVDRLCGTSLLTGIQARVSRRGLAGTLAVSLVLNWVYLVLTGRN